MFDTAEEAAVYLAWVKAHDHPEWENGEPPKMTSSKPRSKKPLQPADQPALTTVAPAEARAQGATGNVHGRSNKRSNAACAFRGCVTTGSNAECSATRLRSFAFAM